MDERNCRTEIFGDPAAVQGYLSDFCRVWKKKKKIAAVIERLSVFCKL